MRKSQLPIYLFSNAGRRSAKQYKNKNNEDKLKQVNRSVCACLDLLVGRHSWLLWHVNAIWIVSHLSQSRVYTPLFQGSPTKLWSMLVTLALRSKFPVVHLAALRWTMSILISKPMRIWRPIHRFIRCFVLSSLLSVFIRHNRGRNRKKMRRTRPFPLFGLMTRLNFC